MFRSPMSPRAILVALLFASTWPATAHASSDGVWSQLGPSISAPSARREQIAVYDQVNQTYLMFGGYGFASTAPEYNFNEVWTLTMNDPPTWTLMTIAGTPPGPRKASQWGWDIARHRLLIFGGYGEHYIGDPVYWLNDVWQLSLDGTPTWTELFPTGTPPDGRLAGVAVFDPFRQRLIGFGGTNGAPVDTWVLDLSGEPAWGSVNTGGQHPNGAYGIGAIYDPLRNRMLAYGGSNGADYYGSNSNVWELTLGDQPIWTQLLSTDSTSVEPPPRRSMTAVYDPMRDRMVIYGGFDAVPGSDQFMGDTWALSLSDSLTWHQLLPEGPIPPGRDASAAIYDPIGDRMVVYGGWSGTSMLGDSEYLTWGDAPSAASFGASASATMAAASVQWTVSQSTGAYTGIFRKTPTGPWTSIGTTTANSTGQVSFVDSHVTPGADYSYEVVASSQRGPMAGGQVAVTIPSVTGVTWTSEIRFSLDPVSPNPVRRNLDVSFTLPRTGPARLEVVDVSGRVVARRDVGALGAGTHRVTMASAHTIPPGVYFVRLSRPGQLLTRRAVVLGR